jgi:hypothetical protein
LTQNLRSFPLSEATSRFLGTSNRLVKQATRSVLPIFLAAVLSGGSDYASAKAKFDSIESDRLPAGSRVQLSPIELNAYVSQEVRTVTDGVRNPQMQLLAPGLVRGSALIDFAKVRRSQGHPPGWLMSKLLEGERPVTVTARITSAGGQATVDVQQIQISGIDIDGGTLDFLIQTFVLPLYPNAMVGRPFALGHRIERVDVKPAGVVVAIGA